MTTTLATAAARTELAELLDRHGIAFEVRDPDGPLSFGRRDDGQLVVAVPAAADWPEALAFARKVIADEEEGRKLDAVSAALLPFRHGDPHLAALVEAFIQARAWHRGAVVQFVELIERGLGAFEQENRA